MKKIYVNSCEDCPFLYSKYDDYAVGCSTIDVCTLAQYNNSNEYIISIHDNMGSDENIETPKWCPLKQESINIKISE